MKNLSTLFFAILIGACSFLSLNASAQEKTIMKKATAASFDRSGQTAPQLTPISLMTNSPAKAACDTLNLALYKSTWSLADYSVTATPAYSSGFVNGVNTYGDKMKANYFANTNANTYIYGGMIAFSRAYSTTPSKTITIKVWSVSSGNPGTVLASKTFPMSEIMTDVNGNYFTNVVFDTPVNIAGAAFFMGVDFSNLDWATSHDSLSIQSNTAGQTSPSAVWEYQSDNTWHQYTTAGAWNLSISLAVFPIMSNVLADASFTQSATNTCTGYPVSLNASASVQSGVYWSLPGATPSSSNALTPTVTYATAGTYPIKLYVAGGSCNNLDSMITSITIAASPIPNASATPSSICNGQSTTLSAQNGSSYQWNGFSPSPVPTQLVNPTTNTNYTVTVTGSNGCSASQNVAVTVNQLPTANASANPTTICLGEGTFLTAAPGMSTYSWSPVTNSTAAFWDYPVTNTTYTVTVIDGNSCQNTGSVSVTVDACTGVSGPVSEQGFDVYPNPSNGMVSVHLSKDPADAEYIEIYAMDGRLMKRENVIRTDGNYTQLIDLTDFSKGVYYLHLHAWNQSFERKIVIQ